MTLPAVLGPLTVAAGPPAWAWTGGAPDLPIDPFDPPAAEPVPDWGVDHVVVTSDDLDATVGRLAAGGADPRRTGTTARGTTAAFVLAGTLIEVIAVERGPTRLVGIAYETDHDLEDVVARWRAAGIDAGDPHPAVQPGRAICSVRGAAVAVMTRRPSGSPG